MKPIILTLTLLLLTILPAGAVKRIEAHPVNVAAMIAEKGDSAHIDSYFKYYGYTQDGTDANGYTVMRHRNGNEIRYTFQDGNSIMKYPTVIVKTNDTHKAIDERLSEIKFHKAGNSYESTNPRMSYYQTTCCFGPHNTLIFRTTEK